VGVGVVMRKADASAERESERAHERERACTTKRERD